jgi:hypothetical protein
MLAGYAWAKVVLTFAAWGAAWWMLDDFAGRALMLARATELPAPRYPSALTAGAFWARLAMLFAAAGCLAPLAILLGLRSRPARESLVG